MVTERKRVTLTDAQLRKASSLHRMGYSFRALATRYGVCEKSIARQVAKWESGRRATDA